MVLPRVREKQPSLVIFDLNSSRLAPMEVIAAMKADPALQAVIRTLGYVSHVQTDVIAAARAAGIDEVLARSAFSERLGQILSASDRRRSRVHRRVYDPTSQAPQRPPREDSATSSMAPAIASTRPMLVAEVCAAPRPRQRRPRIEDRDRRCAARRQTSPRSGSASPDSARRAFRTTSSTSVGTVPVRRARRRRAAVHRPPRRQHLVQDRRRRSRCRTDRRRPGRALPRASRSRAAARRRPSCSNPPLGGQLERRNLRVPLRGDHDRLRAQPAVDEPGGVRVGHGVGDLDRHLHGAAHVHRPPRHLGAERLALQELEHEVDAALVLADVEQRGDVRMRQAREARAPARSSAAAASGVKSAGSSRTATVRPSRVSRARNSSPGPAARAARAGCSGQRRRSAPGDRRVMRSRLDDALQQLLGVADLLEDERDVERRPAGGARALAVDAVLPDHRERVGQQIERHRQPPARLPHHRLVTSRARRGACRRRTSRESALRGAAAPAESRRGSAGCAPDAQSDRATTSATSSGASSHSDFVLDRPPNPVLTEPGSTYATRMPSCRTSCISASLKALSAAFDAQYAAPSANGVLAGEAADVDDPAAAARPQVRQRRAAAVEDAGQVGLDDVVPFVRRSCRRPDGICRRRRCSPGRRGRRSARRSWRSPPAPRRDSERWPRSRALAHSRRRRSARPRRRRGAPRSSR